MTANTLAVNNNQAGATQFSNLSTMQNDRLLDIQEHLGSWLSSHESNNVSVYMMGAFPLHLTRGSHEPKGVHSEDALTNKLKVVISAHPISSAIHINEETPTFAQARPNPIQQYRQRIAQLRKYGLEDGFNLNKASQNDFRCFVESIPAMRRASLILKENGNLRANWLDDGIGQAGIEFFGDGTAEFVFYDEPSDVWKAGMGTLNEVKERIKSFGLAELVGI